MASWIGSQRRPTAQKVWWEKARSNNEMDQITAHRPRYWAHMGSYGPIFLISPPLSLFCFPKIQQTHSSSSFCSSRADRAGVLDFQFIVVVVGGRGNEMTSLSGLVPITKSFLSRYYDKYPFPPLSHDVSRLTDQLQELAERLQKEHPLDSDEERVSREAGLSVPQKIDENMWKNREHIEEMLFLLEESHWPKLLQQKATDEDRAIVSNFRIKLQSTFKALESFQIRNTDNVFSTVMTYMPQDFRGSLIRQQRERSERSRQAVVDALINSGGSIHDKYALMWTQQMDRRSQLAQLGSATGVYKALVKYLVGVPQVLLDFVRQINDDHGPMEEQRQRYGPSFYRLTKLAIYIRLCLLLSWGRCKTNKIEKDQMSILEHAINVYTLELERFLNFIGDVFANSPFLISADEAGALESSESNDYKEIIIPAGKKHEVSLTIDTVNSYIAWDFSLTQGKNMDIGFTLEHVSPSGQISMILPYQRYESDQGNFSTIVTGCYKLTWDNSYSKFFKKNLRYKVDAIPPVEEIVEPVTEEAELC